jgi:phosphatidate cytidylyltransferase
MAAGILVLGGDEPIMLASGEDGPTSVFVSGFNFHGVALSLLILFVLATFLCELYRMDYKGSTGAQALSSAGMTILSFVYPVWLFAFALSALDEPTRIYNLLWLVLATKMSDIWAYVSGVLLGGRFIKPKFSPVVSPKKTWEGIIGSFIITSLCAWGLFWLTKFPFELTVLQFFCVLMPCIFVLSVAGDLAGSLIKRGLAVKDSGSLLPGIGGIFDLIDSPAFTVAFFSAVMIII